MSVKIKKVDKITPSVNRINKQLQRDVPKEAFKTFLENTPVADGNARSKTKLKGSTIVADYPYAKRLDEGYSRQAPEGMTKPTIKKVDKFIRGVLRRK